MEKKFSIKKGLKVFIIIFRATMAFAALIAGILIVFPAEASKLNRLGYYSVCPFVPFSTLILLGMSFIGFILLRKKVASFKRKDRGSKNGLKNHIILEEIQKY
ncbi:MAG: hypothetical protein ACXABO_14560 [Promethearchaeota archaeon]|jgi:hypothetical protein